MNDKESDLGKVTRPVHPENIPAPPDTDPGEARWVKVVKTAVREELAEHEKQAKARANDVLRYIEDQNRWRASIDRRMRHIETHGAPLAATLLLVLACTLLGAHVYIENEQLKVEFARLDLARTSPVIRAEKAFAPAKP